MLSVRYPGLIAKIEEHKGKKYLMVDDYPCGHTRTLL